MTTRRSPAEEKSIIRERLQQAEQGLAGSGKADAISGDPGESAFTHMQWSWAEFLQIRSGSKRANS